MSDIYRDRSEGATAKRQELLRRRRDELVMMPHAIRRVVVARSARAAASLAVLLAGVALLATASSPAFAAWLARGLPGIQPAVLSTLLGATWIIGVCVYAISRARGEHLFAVAMSRYVLPTSDVDQDLQRLDHEHPDEAARQMAHGLEVRSAALPVIAAAFVLPATAVYVVHAIDMRGWPVISNFEASLAAHAGTLIEIAMAGMVAGVVMTRRAARLPIVSPIARACAVAALGLAFVTRHTGASWIALAITTITATIAVVTLRLRIERALIATEDPAAGSELFTLRGLVKRVRASVVTARDGVRWLVHRRAVMLVGAAVGIGIGIGAYQHSTRTQKPVAQSAPTRVQPFTVEPAASPIPIDQHYQMIRANDNRVIEGPGILQLDLDLDGNKPFPIQSLAGIDVLAKNWRVDLTVELGSASPGPLWIRAFGSSDRFVESAARGVVMELAADACDEPKALGMVLQAPTATAGPHHVTLYLTPRLGVARC